MASETVYRCDVCGREIPYHHDRLEIRLGDCSADRRAKLKIGGLYDMCEDCTVKFVRMFKEMTAMKDETQSRIERVLSGKTPEEQYDILYWLMMEYGKGYSNSRLARIEWLRGEKEGEQT